MLNVMNKIKRHFHILFLSMSLLLTIVACEDLAFGDKFLQKPPSTDVTIDTVFSTAEYARRILWYSYQYLPYGLETSGYWTTMWLGNLEGLTDLNSDNVGYSGVQRVYYNGDYNSSRENTNPPTYYRTKIRFNESETHMWSAIRHAWIFYNNVDKVPDMDQEEKERMKAEAKMLVAVYYAHMLRHYGGLPIIDRALTAEADMPQRATLQETVDFIIGLLDDAIACEQFPWRVAAEDMAQWDGRLTKAGAYALKARVLLFVASPLFNSDQPYATGEASDKLMTWFGNYDRERWKAAMDACEDFFNAVAQNGYYRLVQKSDVAEGEYRYAFRKAYFDRGTTETLISVHRNIYSASLSVGTLYLWNALRWGGYCPTKEYFDMFPMADGSDFDWNNPAHAKNPFINRDPRLNETFLMDGDIYQGRTLELTESKPDDVENYPAGKDWGQGAMNVLSLHTGLACRKWGLDRGSELSGHVIQWPHLRIAELHLSYAEAINEYYGAPNAIAYDHLNQVRRRVGLGDLSGLSYQEFHDAVLRERACEFGFEEVRFFDLIRWKMQDKFTTPVHGLHVYKNKNTGIYEFQEFSIADTERNRAWWNPGGFSSIWYLSAFPQDEVNKGYGLVQNPGWE